MTVHRHAVGSRVAAGDLGGVKKSPPPGSPRRRDRPYLDRPRSPKQKGGTLLLKEIRTPEQHAAALANPDLVRPESCPTCRRSTMHVHDRRCRQHRGELGDAASTTVLIVRCANRDRCGAVWRLLPPALARHLHRRWTLVGVVLGVSGTALRHRVPKRTQQRWRKRTALSAAILVLLLGASGVERWRALAYSVTSSGTRRDLIASGYALEELALVIDLQMPGVRLM